MIHQENQRNESASMPFESTYTRGILASLLSRGPRAKTVGRVSTHEIFRRFTFGKAHFKRASQGFFFALSALCAGCGSGSESDPQAQSGGDFLNLTRQQIVANASVSCKSTPVVGTWKALHTGQGSNTYDTVEIGEDCFFKTFVCGTEGYIDSDVSADFGIAEVVYMQNAGNSSNCPTPGRYRCNYRISAPFYREMVIDCLPN